MPVLDVFDNNDAFNSVSLTEAINKLPAVPGKIGQSGLFGFKGVPTTSVMIEERDGRLQILASKPRGAPATPHDSQPRRARAFVIQHLPFDSSIRADDLQNIRQFGSENQLEGVSSVVADTLAEMRASHDTTHEWYRAGAIQGQILDADGVTVLLNLFTEFGVTELSVPFTMNDANSIKTQARAVTRHISDNLGAQTYSGITGYCGDQFYDALITSDGAKEAFDRWQEGAFLRSDNREGFPYAGINWQNYPARVGSQNFIATNKARFVATGANDLFREYFGPADYVEAVNTVGKRIYAKQERQKFDKGIDVNTQSNPLMMCTRPGTLVEGTMA